MTAHTFEDVRALVLRCLEVDDPKRMELLAEVANRQPNLAAAARMLLAHDSETIPGSLDEPGRTPEDLPERVGRYEVRERLGAGGMGIVYLAFDDALGREIAVKVLPEPMSADASALARFRREARLLARVDHPHIATVYSLEESGGRAFITMERVDGSSLAARLRENALTVEATIALGREIASALESAHAKGVVHYDLKPSNVMVSELRGAKVLDFGLSTLTEPGRDPETNDDDRSTPPMGTPGYMSPERLAGSPAASAADVWALGCVLAESLLGDRLFPPAETNARPDLDVRLPDAPQELRALLDRCLSPTPEDRPTASEVLETLADLEAGGFGSRPSLPTPLTRFVGRAGELRDLSSLMERARLVTVVGLGGVGKTRLAIEAVRRAASSHRVLFVDLSSTRTVGVEEAVAAIAGVRDRRSQSRFETLASELGREDTILVLDNCEPVLAETARLADALLRACESLRLLATSREPLGVAGERTYGLAPFRDGEEAIELFADRAQMVASNFEVTKANAAVVSEICRCVDALPLAIELSAALVPLLDPEEILERVRQGPSQVDVTTGSQERRETSLRSVLEDSYRRLTEAERRAFAVLSVFRGFTLAAASDVVTGSDEVDPLELLAGLVRKSLIVRHVAPGGSVSRYRMLEVVREFAAEKLEAATRTGAVKDRHLDHFAKAAFAIRITGAGQARQLAEIEADEGNMRAAVDHAKGVDSGALPAARIALGMAALWIRRGRWAFAANFCTKALDDLLATRGEEVTEAVRLRRTLAELAVARGDLDEARRQLTTAQASAAIVDEELLIGVLNTLGTVEQSAGNLTEARSLYDRAIELRDRYPEEWDLSGMLLNRGAAKAMQEEFDLALIDFERSLEIKRRIGDERGVSHALNALGLVATQQGRFDEASELLTESLTIKRELADKHGLITTLGNLGLNKLDRYESASDSRLLHEAATLYEESLDLSREIGNAPNEVESLVGIAWARLLAGDLEKAREAEGLAASCARTLNSTMSRAGVDEVGAAIALEQEDEASFVDHVRRVLEALESCGVRFVPSVADLIAWSFVSQKDAAATASWLSVADVHRDSSRRAAARWRTARNAEAKRWALESLGDQSFAAYSEKSSGIDDIAAVRAMFDGE